MRKNNRGQISFEILLLTAIILAAAIGVSTYYLSVKGATLAMQLTKVYTLNEIDRAGDGHTIEKISFQELGTTITLTVKTCPAAIGFASADLRTTILNNTKYTNATINQIQGTGC